VENNLLKLSALAVILNLSACATITRGTTTSFSVTSHPDSAQVSTSSGFSCAATPCTFRMPRKDGFTLTVSKTGYKSAQVKIESKIAGAGAAGMAGNILIGGIIGGAFDATSGAMDDLIPNPVDVTLVPEDPPSPAVKSEAKAVEAPATPATAPQKEPKS
jgi:hypothetical protein